MVDHQEPNSIGNEAQAPEPKPKGGFAVAARRVLSQTISELKEGLTSLDVREKQVPLEEITERKVAEIIDQNLYNPLRSTIGQEKRLPFDVTHVLTNMGYISATPDNYQQKFPDAYRLSRIALLKLYHQGVLDIALDEGTNVHGEDMHYKVTDEEKLQDYLKQPKK
ncbi:MAG: hypothetical protein AAB702_01215 [Patescibacteria group bacterium]